MESISGLPAHVLLVHAPVVLMPLAFLLTIVLTAKPDWRRRSGFLLTGAAVAVFAATVLAVFSGRAFDDIVGDRVDTSDHENLAIITLVLVGLFVIASLSLAVFDRWGRRGGPTWLGSATVISLAATLVISGLATFWMVQTGDEGARLVWDGVIVADGP